MTSVVPLGSYARHVHTVRTLAAGQNNIDTLSAQLTSGKKSTDLRGFGPDAERLLKLRTEAVNRQAFITAIDNVAARVKAADLVLNRLDDIARDMSSTSFMPINPGPVRIDPPVDNDPDKMQVTVNEERSEFRVNAKYTVTAVPASASGTYDITLHDGLGGRATATLNLDSVPPGDGLNHTFEIAGGPGEGALVNLTFDNLISASSSSFEVSWPETEVTKTRVETYLTEIRNLLNEKVGDRFLFAGSRYSTEPVGDLTAQKQVTRVTLDGSVGRAGDLYQLTVDGNNYNYVTTGLEPSLSAIASNLASQVINTSPALPITVTTANGVITLSGQTVDDTFDVDGSVLGGPTFVDVFSTPVATQAASPTQVQISETTLSGTAVDIGDTYKMKVSIGDPLDPFNAKYYMDNPNAPRTRPVYEEFEVEYTITYDDFHNNGINSVTAVAAQLATVVNATQPPLPVTATATAGTGLITLTGTTNDVAFTAEPSVVDGKLSNTLTVATLPPDITSLTTPRIVNEPDLPFYDNDWAPNATSEKAWDTAKVRIDDSLVIDYGIASTNETFQTLIQAFRYARAAVEQPGNYNEFIEDARQLFIGAKDDLRAMAGKNASDLGTMEITRDAHTNAKLAVANQLADIEGIDQTDVSVRLSSAITTQEAAYTVTARTQQLQLINYIA